MTNRNSEPAFPWLSSAVISLAIVLVASALAQAQSVVEYCVRCTEPAATHVCTVDVDEEGAVSISEWKAFCASQVAFDGSHDQCRAEAGVADCNANTMYSYRSSRRRSVADTAPQPVPGEPGVRPGGGFFEGAGEFVRRTGEAVSEGASAVGRTVRDGADYVGDTATDVGRGLKEGAEDVGEGVSRGVGCVFTLGQKC